VYSFKSLLPPSFFSNLLVRLMRSGWTLHVAWHTGLLMSLDRVEGNRAAGASPAAKAGGIFSIASPWL
jgi:hypothetical protein